MNPVLFVVLLGLSVLGLAVGLGFLIGGIAAFFYWRVSVRVVDEDELRKAGL
jgi:hypothetical protein